MHGRSGNLSLVGLLAAVLLLGVAAYVMLLVFQRNTLSDAPAGSGAKNPKEYAEGEVVCRSQLDQIRKAIQMAETQGGEDHPKSLAGLSAFGIGQSMTRCPVGKVAYKYDAQTGKVQCPYSGHERL